MDFQNLRSSYKETQVQLIIESMLKSIDTLDNHYGISRDVIKDLGGMVLWIEDKNDWNEIKELFHLQIGLEEYIEYYELNNGNRITELLFQISSDYGIVIFTMETNLQ